MSRIPFNSVGGFSVGTTGQYVVIDATGNVVANTVNVRSDPYTDTLLTLGDYNTGDSLEVLSGIEGNSSQLKSWTIDKTQYANLYYTWSLIHI